MIKLVFEFIIIFLLSNLNIYLNLSWIKLFDHLNNEFAEYDFILAILIIVKVMKVIFIFIIVVIICG